MTETSVIGSATDGAPADATRAEVWNCDGCGYDLTRVPATHESHYGFLIVTCPECGRAEPFAAAARKRDRGGVFATLWRLAWAAVLIFGCAGAVGGLAQSTGYAASVPLARKIAAVQTMTPFERPPIAVSVYRRVPLQSSGNSAATVGLKDVGGWSRGVPWSVLTDLLWYIPIALGFTVMWALAWRRMSGRKLVWLALFVSAVAGVGLVAYYCDSMSRYGWEWAITLAEWKVGVWIAAGNWVVGAAALVVGARVARPIARFLVFMFVPPVLRVGMRELWTADGLAVPVE